MATSNPHSPLMPFVLGCLECGIFQMDLDILISSDALKYKFLHLNWVLAHCCNCCWCEKCLNKLKMHLIVCHLLLVVAAKQTPPLVCSVLSPVATITFHTHPLGKYETIINIIITVLIAEDRRLKLYNAEICIKETSFIHSVISGFKASAQDIETNCRCCRHCHCRTGND